MDAQWFDQLARAFALSSTRRVLLKATVSGFVATVVASMPGPVAQRMRRSARAAASGCCKCSGTASGCLDVQSQAACDTLCGTAIGIFSEKHTCKKGGAGTTNQCRLKTGTALEQACIHTGPCGGDGATPAAALRAHLQDDCPEPLCTGAATIPATPITVAAHDLAERAGDGWATRQASACFQGDACKGGNLFDSGFAAYNPFDPTKPVNFDYIFEQTNILGQQAVRRATTPDVPSDTTLEIYVEFISAADAERLERDLRAVAPEAAVDRTDEIAVDGLAFAFSMTGPTSDIPDPAAETITGVARTGNVLIISSTTSTSNDVVEMFNERVLGMITALGNPPETLELQLLVDSIVHLRHVPGVSPVGDLAVTVLDGRTLPQDLESTESFEYRLLTDADTVHAVRIRQTVDTDIGPAFVVHEVREFGDEEAASTFIIDSLGRVKTRFGPMLTAFPITEIRNNVGHQSDAFLYVLTDESGNFVVGGVTGQSRFGSRVAVTNVNIRPDGTATPVQFAAVQDGRFFANASRAVLEGQIAVWSGDSFAVALSSPLGALGLQMPEDQVLGGPCGQGQPDCAAGLTCCDGFCRDTNRDPNNCRLCRNVCADGGTCCAGSCVDLQVEAVHCGACGNVCADGRVCCSGRCVNTAGRNRRHCGACNVECPDGTSCCGNGECADLKINNRHCGECNNVCEPPECCDGVCCPPGDVCCGNRCADLQADRRNCGACGTKCPTGFVCEDGECIKGEEPNPQMYAVSPADYSNGAYQAAGRGRGFGGSTRFFTLDDGFRIDGLTDVARAAGDRFEEAFVSVVNIAEDDEHGHPAYRMTDSAIRLSLSGLEDFFALGEALTGSGYAVVDGAELGGFKGLSMVATRGPGEIAHGLLFDSGLYLRTFSTDDREAIPARLAETLQARSERLLEKFTTREFQEASLAIRQLYFDDTLFDHFYLWDDDREVFYDKPTMIGMVDTVRFAEALEPNRSVLLRQEFTHPDIPEADITFRFMSTLSRFADPGAVELDGIEPVMREIYPAATVVPVDAPTLGDRSMAWFYDRSLEGGGGSAGMVVAAAVGDTLIMAEAGLTATGTAFARFNQGVGAQFPMYFADVVVPATDQQVSLLRVRERPSARDAIRFPDDKFMAWIGMFK